MPFKSKAQAKFMFANHPKLAKEFAAHTKSIKALPTKVSSKEKFKGKGTRARLNTAAEKKMFNSQYSM